VFNTLLLFCQSTLSDIYFCFHFNFPAEVSVLNGAAGYEKYPGYSMVIPFTNQRFTKGTLVTMSNGFEVSTIADSRWIVKNMYRAYPWGSNGLLLQEPSIPFDFLYNKTDTNLNLNARVVDEHDALREAIVLDEKRLKSYVLFTFEDRLNHELLLGGKSYYDPILTGLSVEKVIGPNLVKSNMYHRISWNVVTEQNRVVQNTNEADFGLNAMNDLLAGMPNP
jgi:hypothetical protein